MHTSGLYGGFEVSYLLHYLYMQEKEVNIEVVLQIDTKK